MQYRGIHITLNYGNLIMLHPQTLIYFIGFYVMQQHNNLKPDMRLNGPVKGQSKMHVGICDKTGTLMSLSFSSYPWMKGDKI